MQLHNLKRSHTLRYKKTRVGRGGKRGTTSGHGTKGQKSRAGRRIRPAERDFLQRLPKLRGTKNHPKQEKVAVVNLETIEKYIKGSLVNREVLHKAGFLRNPIGTIKILGFGTLTRAITVQKIPVSESAKKKIESAGGKIE